MIACILCLGLAASKEGEEEEVEAEVDVEESGRSKVVSGFLAILLGLVGALLMATKHLLIRGFKAGYSGFD